MQNALGGTTKQENGGDDAWTQTENGTTQPSIVPLMDKENNWWK